MSQALRSLTFSMVVLFAASFTLAGPADLLKQAIEENEAAPAPTGDDVDVIIQKADWLADLRQFADAIKLYERAYRLSPTNQSSYVRLLVAKRSAGVMTAQDREALELIREQQAAEVKQTFRGVRLRIIQARQALRSRDVDLARSMVGFAESALDGLPRYVDDSPYRHELKKLGVAIRRRAKRISKSADKADVTRVGGRSGADSFPKPLTLMDAGDDSGESVESGEIIDVDEILRESHERHVYDRELAHALRKSRAQVIISNIEAAFPPPQNTDMTFPENWAERTDRRAKYRDGIIYKGKPFTGPDGQEYHTAIYDLGDLVHPVPNFYASYPGSVRQQRFETDDRFYLNYRSQIFGGYADDLAAGLPLLHFFGGIDNNAISTRTDPRETQRIMQILDRFIQSP